MIYDNTTVATRQKATEIEGCKLKCLPWQYFIISPQVLYIETSQNTRQYEIYRSLGKSAGKHGENREYKKKGKRNILSCKNSQCRFLQGSFAALWAIKRKEIC